MQCLEFRCVLEPKERHGEVAMCGLGPLVRDSMSAGQKAVNGTRDY